MVSEGWEGESKKAQRRKKKGGHGKQASTFVRPTADEEGGGKRVTIKKEGNRVQREKKRD